ncbi:unnamed protein product [Moneuplotes crassus]|uniref:Uncharacterized protein n=1 Tax=Euplotes crassus TaxID=5936 RepID=A0AAD1XN55_EUPCR|nr:unnamed protein product [Moneuplotes crassus]
MDSTYQSAFLSAPFSFLHPQSVFASIAEGRDNQPQNIFSGLQDHFKAWTYEDCENNRNYEDNCYKSVSNYGRNTQAWEYPKQGPNSIETKTQRSLSQSCTLVASSDAIWLQSAKSLGSRDSTQIDSGIHESLPSELTCIEVSSGAMRKSTLRRIRKFFRNLFKTNNRDLVSKRYSNCKISHLYERLRKTLTRILPEEVVTKEMIYFTMGLINIKKISELPCSLATKSEVSAFLASTRIFSYKKLRKALESPTCRALCWCFVNNSEDPKVGFLTEVLQEFSSDQ